MPSRIAIAILLAPMAALALSAAAEPVASPLLPAATVTAIAQELSGTRAKLTIQALTLNHRIRGSQGFKVAAEMIRERAVQSGLSEVEVISLPADGKIFYGTQRSRPGWDAEFAELWEQRPDGGGWRDDLRIASYAEEPVVLAQDSISGKVSADLVDVGRGASVADYQGKDVRGRLVLTSAQPGAAAPLAIGRFGAAGIVSYARNQEQAWSREDGGLIRWGHMEAFNKTQGFGIMVTPDRAAAWRDRLARGEIVHLRAEVVAGQHPSTYLIPTAVIPGADRAHEIVFSCHLDHQRPGANDNASGCAGILEIARSLQTLIASGRLPKPQRTLRFIWPPEVEGTISLLNARPEFAHRALTNVHMDMIGGDPAITGGVLRVYRSPQSLPTFVNDVAWAFTDFANRKSLEFADTGAATPDLIDGQGDKQALQAIDGTFTEGSDHEIWAEGSWKVPTIYFADWPDRFIHTNRDSVSNIDPTKLKRAMFIAASSAWYLANFRTEDAEGLWTVIQRDALTRAAETAARAERLKAGGAPTSEVTNLWRYHFDYEDKVAPSIDRYASLLPAVAAKARTFDAGLRRLLAPKPLATSCAADLGADGSVVYRRAAEPKGPMHGMGHDYLVERLETAGRPHPAILDLDDAWTEPSFGYELLNLVDGIRTVCGVRDDLFAINHPRKSAEVAEYLKSLENLRLLERVR